jgi:hypothetical protein
VYNRGAHIALRQYGPGFNSENGSYIPLGRETVNSVVRPLAETDEREVMELMEEEKND